MYSELQWIGLGKYITKYTQQTNNPTCSEITLTSFSTRKLSKFIGNCPPKIFGSFYNYWFMNFVETYTFRKLIMCPIIMRKY